MQTPSLRTTSYCLQATSYSMFDEPPANLPFESGGPTAGPAPEPPLDEQLRPRPASSVPKPTAPPGGGMVMPRKQEPEDIFGDLEKSAGPSSGGPAANLPERSGAGRGGLRIVMYVVIGVVVLAALGAGGYFAYNKFLVPAPAST